MDICQAGNGFNGMVNKATKGGSAIATALKEAKTRFDGPVSSSSVSPAGRKAIVEGIKAEGIDTKEARKKVGLAKRAITNATRQQSYKDLFVEDF